MIKQDLHIFTGMQQDLPDSKFKENLLKEANNIRLTSKDAQSTLNITGELGTAEITIVFPDESNISAIQGTYLGHCILGKYLVLFTHDSNKGSSPDFIYRIDISNIEEVGMYPVSSYTANAVLLYNGDLNFRRTNPIETLGIYENEFIQKVYWTDGINQPRVINITKDKLSGVSSNYINTSFDFVQTLQLNENVIITKETSSSGAFPAGCVQYAITYYNKYGQESNIAWISPLLYTSFSNRAGSPDETIGNAFKLKITKFDTNFDYLRVYSIIRSSLNGTAVTKKVCDINLTEVSGELKGSIKDSGFYFIIDDPKTYCKINNNASWTTIKALEDNHELTPEIISNSSILPAGSYYHFSKSQYPHLIIQFAKDSIYNTYTWGDTSDIYISAEKVSGPGEIAYKIFGLRTDKNGNKTTGHLLVGENFSYGQATDGIIVVDDNTTGESVDSDSLLYVGGEVISAETITQKDGTLFLGNIKILRESIPKSTKDALLNSPIKSATRDLFINSDGNKNYSYVNTLNVRESVAYDMESTATNSSTFKYGERYRLGLQFQYKTGRWSNPVMIKDMDMGSKPSLNDNILSLPIFTNESSLDLTGIHNLGYKKVRPVVVFPSFYDRKVLAQGILCPTVYDIRNRKFGTPHEQSSWFLRPFPPHPTKEPSESEISFTATKTGNTPFPISVSNSGTTRASNNAAKADNGSTVQWRHQYTLYGDYDRGAEIQGIPYVLSGIKLDNPSNFQNTESFGELISDKQYSITSDKGKVILKQDSTEASKWGKVDVDGSNSLFCVDQSIVTMHSPDIEFDSSLNAIDFESLGIRIIGNVGFSYNIGDINIETSSPTISQEGSGFIHRSLSSEEGEANRSLNAGLFYSDFLVDDLNNKGTFFYEEDEKTPFLFMVYPWNKNGSLNNDTTRPTNGGTRSAVLRRKVISNLKFSNTTTIFDKPINLKITKPQLFNSDQMVLTKLQSDSNYNYYGNVDTLLAPLYQYGMLFSTGDTSVNINGYYNATFKDPPNAFKRFTTSGAYIATTWDKLKDDKQGDYTSGLRAARESIRMRYKSTAHLVFSITKDTLETYAINNTPSTNKYPFLFLAELYRTNINESTMFGGTTEDALQNNIWYPAGEAISIPSSGIIGENTIKWKYGDTWYERYDCLKTYSFTQEDPNSIVEIGSFLVESRVNIDGRYDKNRGKSSNLNINNTNFNLINKVYSQVDSFFSYRILDQDYYNLSNYPNTVTWTTMKGSGESVDPWTRITMASTLNVDGAKGEVTALRVFKDNIYCFQDKGVSAILFNSRVQIPTSDGVPVEISNNYKVDGYKYIFDNTGCYNKWSIVTSSAGLYFYDRQSKSFYVIGNGVNPISDTLNMSTWFTSLDNSKWESLDWKGIKTFYDNIEREIYIVAKNKALIYSERLGQFESFVDYGSTDAIFSTESGLFAIHGTTPALHYLKVNHLAANFFGTQYPIDFTFVSNQDATMDKIFTNLECSAEITNLDIATGPDSESTAFFSTIRVWNEYQDTGEVPLTYNICKPSNTKKKFRIWRVQIPRDSVKKLNRIRNTWARIKLTMDKNAKKDFTLHDLIVTYYL